MTDAQPGVLVVDDDAALLTLMTRTGARFGYDVLTAGDGPTALALARSRHVDVVVTDLEMPRQSGHALIRQLRTEQPDLPIILMSGAGSIDDVVEGLRAGITDYLKKPFHPSDFSQSVQRALDARHSTPARSAPTAAPALAVGSAPAATVVPGVDASNVEVPEPLTIKLIELQEQPGLSSEVVVRVIERSQTIAARVLTLSNSAYYRGQRPVTNLREAIVRLGNRTVLNLAVTLTHRSYYTLKSEAYTDLLGRLWTENVFVASLAREIARRGLGGDPEDVYLAALFHDLGEVVLVRQLASSNAPLDVQQIAATCEAQHEAIGETVLPAWKLPSRICRIAANHHRIPAPPGRPSLTAVEEQIAHILVVCHAQAVDHARASPIRFATDPAAAMATLGLSPRHVEPLVERVLLLLGDDGGR